MKGLRRVSRPSRGRRFKGTEDPKALEHTRAQRCLLSGKRITVTVWRGVYPNRKEVELEMQHQCDPSGRVEAHHTVTKARGGKDSQTVPLCRFAHDELHKIGQRAFCQKWGVSL